MENATQKIEAFAKADQENAISNGRLANIAMVSFLVAALTACALLFWAAQVTLVRPLRALTERMAQLAAGDTQAVVEGVDRRDEIGAMVRATQTFRDGMVEKARLEALTKAEEEKRRAADNVVAAERSRVVSAAGEGMAALAAGDLTCHMPETIAGDYTQLRENFNAAVDQLAQTIAIVRGNTGEIHVKANEISQASAELSERTERQAVTLERTAAALNEITATVKATASGARQTSEAVTAARGEAERSSLVVEQAVAVMSQIEQSSQHIGRIIGVIDEIAFQTNLLALNAGVEAARAGESGRGFAVVAQEVRALAGRSAKAAKEIQDLISSSSQQVNNGVGLVGQTGTALTAICAKITKIDQLISDISLSAQQQSVALEDVNSSVNQMDQATQQNATMVEETTAAIHLLSSQTEELQRLVASFNVGARQVDVPVKRSEKITQVARPRAAAKPEPRRQPVSVGNTALAADDWKEF